MTRYRSLAFLAALAAGTLWVLAQEGPTRGDAAPDAPETVELTPLPSVAEESADPAAPAPYEEVIRKADQAYVAAFNAKDAQALAALWSPEAVYVDRRTGDEVVGRKAIAAEYATLFESSPDLTIAIEAESLQLLSPGVVVERGAATFKAPGTDDEAVNFVAVWVRRDGGWLLDRVSDEADVDPSPHYQHLRELEWMVGEWVDQDDEVTAETTCRWAKNKNFLVREFAVSVGDEIDISGMQVIGWNAANKRVQSWTFDSDGGFAEGVWSKTNDRWFVRNRGYTSEGELVTNTNVIRPIDDDSFGWRTIERIIEGEILPNVDETLVVRRR